MTKQHTNASDSPAPQGDGAPDGKIEGFGDRGVWVPRGMTPHEIMAGARVLEDQFDIPPYQSRSMVRAVLAAIRSIT